MFNYKLNSDGSHEFSALSPEDLVPLFSIFRNLFPKKNKFLNYDPNWLAEFYHSEKINWLKSSDEKIRAPYEIIHDFRKNPVNSWGTFENKGKYQLPNELSRVKHEMVKSFSKDGLLYKGDNPCPRICNAASSSKALIIEIQKAAYYDQVATNLSLDYKHNHDIAESIGTYKIRHWDILQSNTAKGELPSFSKSKLGNTIGISMGIIATNELGQKIILSRRRTSAVAVYQQMQHLPFSFSLNLDSAFSEKNTKGTIQELVKLDFRHEQAEELGLEPSDIDFADVKPLVFCRDLSRGGKPQFFFEIEIKTPYEELIRKISEQSKTKREFSKKTTGMTMNFARKNMNNFSPELLAYIVLKS